MLSLHTNAASLITQSALGNAQKALSTSMARLGTGYRINSAMDDAAGLQIATRLEAQTRGMAVAMRNTQNGISLLQTAEGAFTEVTNILLRMKDLATQAADASSSDADRTALQAEYDALGLELKNIMTNTTFGGEKLFDSATATSKLRTSMTFQIGATSSETMDVDLTAELDALDNGSGGALYNVSSTYSGTSPGTEFGTAGSANAIIDVINTALDTVGALRAALGANANRLEHVYNNLTNMSTNTTQARGRIMDVDYASETANMTARQMLMQAGTAMLKQSSSMNQLVLALMQ